MTPREEILRRVRDGLMALPDDERTVTLSRHPRHAAVVSPVDRAAAVEQFLEQAKHYGAEGERLTEPELADRVNLALRAHGITSVLAPDGLPEEWLEHWSAPDEHRTVVEHSQQSASEPVDAIVTTCTGAVADSGTLVLDGGPGQLRRTPALVPPCHVCVVRAEQIVPTLPEVLDKLDPRHPITFYGGPSGAADLRATGDSPRRLIVFVVE
ncbi:LutC/YkgG family protein [Nocardia blacklockiae]|uniref:LutC/YkgG family protein n=1 Tax=Nocardia blacklockiae TaxID=480036 RepID=UPI001895E2AA|nr:LUD domain-containing protein [Nocardia blacklockiae]MBF6173293.1 LUD domain-containing protein [Nocardia blacklockiae]